MMKPWVLVLLFSFLVFLFIPNLKPFNFKLKNGWDALNFVLVLFAILCGILSKNTNGGDEAAEKPSPTPRSQDWFPAQEPLVVTPTVGIRRMRSSSSYPDLRQEAAAWGEAWRFTDDFEIYRNRRSGWASPPRDSDFKTIPVDTVILRRSDPPPPPPPRSGSPPPPTPPPPPPPPPPQRRPLRRSFGNVPKGKQEEEKKVKEEIEVEIEKPYPPPSPAPPPPPPPPPSKGLRRKSSSGAKDLASALASFYQKKKKKGRKTKKTHEESQTIGTPPPPPPPPPPPSFTLAHLFSHKKSTAKKKIHSIPSPAPPPPPPLPPSALRSKKPYKKRDQIIHQDTLPPPPPPPPPPPRMIPPSPMIPPASPDVNNKADMFIARFRANLKLEKMNSIREKQHQEREKEEEYEKEEIRMMMMMGGLLDDSN